MQHCQRRSWHVVKHDRCNWNGANKRMDVNIVWYIRDMRSNVPTVCMLFIVYAITVRQPTVYIAKNFRRSMRWLKQTREQYTLCILNCDYTLQMLHKHAMTNGHVWVFTFRDNKTITYNINGYIPDCRSMNRTIHTNYIFKYNTINAIT